MAFLNRRQIVASVTGAAIAQHLAIGEIPTGAVDGVNNIFTTANPVIGTSIDVYVNGSRYSLSAGDYTLTGGNTITLLNPTINPPVAGSAIEVDYIH